MQSAMKSLMSVTAADLMSRALVMIPEAMSVQAAARLLSKVHVSGAPVVDAEGCCVGVLSTTDFLRRAQEPHPDTRPCADAVYAWQILDTGELPAESVKKFMTKDPVTAPPTTTIGDLARMMVDVHIHRVIVVADTDKPIGIVTSTDILAALARAAGAEAEHPAHEPAGIA